LRQLAQFVPGASPIAQTVPIAMSGRSSCWVSAP